MNRTLILSLWRQRLTSPVRVVILAAIVLMPVGLAAIMKGAGFAVLGDAFAIAMVFAVGMIGQDVSTGVLQLLFARPVRRWEYVFSRWLAASSGAAAVAAFQVLLAWGAMSLRGAAPGADTALLFAAGRVVEVFGVVAVMALLSSLIGGYGDLALYVMFTIGTGIVSMAGQSTGNEPALWIGQQLAAILSPRIEVAQIVAGQTSWHAVASYFSTVSLCLLLSVASVNRKELSYASG